MKKQEAISLTTSNPFIKLRRIPKKEWKSIYELYRDKQWPILGQLWNQYKVTEDAICNGCPDGLQKVHTYMKKIYDKFIQEKETDPELKKLFPEFSSKSVSSKEEPVLLAEEKESVTISLDENSAIDDNDKSKKNGKNKTK